MESLDASENELKELHSDPALVWPNILHVYLALLKTNSEMTASE